MTTSTVRSAHPRRVAIIEPNVTGHRLYFVRLLVEEAARRGDEVLVLLATQARSSAEYQLHLRRIEDSFELLLLAEQAHKFGLRTVNRIARDTRSDLIVVPDGDRLARVMPFARRWTGPGTVSVLVLREKSQSNNIPGREALVNSIKAMIYRWADRRPHASVVLLKTALWAGRSPLRVARDPVTMTATPGSIKRVSNELGLDPARHWFAVLGLVDERKNLPMIARSLTGVPGRSLGLLIAGQCSASTLRAAAGCFETLRSSGVSVVVVDRMLSDLELDSMVGAVDTVIMAHSNEGSSGLFGKAAAAGTRIVAAGAKTLRDDIMAHPELGDWAQLTDADLTEALARSVRRPPVPVARTLGNDSFTTALLGPHEERV